MFKFHFARSVGEGSAHSASTDWVETDLWKVARTAAKDAPGFIAAFYVAREILEQRGATVPDDAHLNSVLASYGCPYSVNGDQLVSTVPHVESPTPPLNPVDAVAKALSDATALKGQRGSASALDRAHTALHGYLRQRCHDAAIPIQENATNTEPLQGPA